MSTIVRERRQCYSTPDCSLCKSAWTRLLMVNILGIWGYVENVFWAIWNFLNFRRDFEFLNLGQISPMLTYMWTVRSIISGMLTYVWTAWSIYSGMLSCRNRTVHIFWYVELYRETYPRSSMYAKYSGNPRRRTFRPATAPQHRRV